MAQDIFINIADLPQASEITAGDYFIVENAAGTQIINFADIIIPVENTLITPLVETNTKNIESLTLSAEKINESLLEFTTVNNSITSINSNINTIKADITSIVSRNDSMDSTSSTLSSKILTLEEQLTNLATSNNSFIRQHKISFPRNSTVLTIMFDQYYDNMSQISEADIMFVPVNEYAWASTKNISVSDISLNNKSYTLKVNASFKSNYLEIDKNYLIANLGNNILDDSLSTYSVSSFTYNVMNHILSSISSASQNNSYPAMEDAEYVMLVFGTII